MRGVLESARQLRLTREERVLELRSLLARRRVLEEELACLDEARDGHLLALAREAGEGEEHRLRRAR